MKLITINEICLLPKFEPSELRLIYSLALCIIFDIIIGVIKAIQTKEISSKTGILGLSKHLIIFILVIIGKIILNNLGLENLIIPFTTFYIIFYLVSITESLSKLGVPIPNFITDRLEQLKKSDDPDFKTYEE